MHRFPHSARARAQPQEALIANDYDTRVDDALRVNKNKSRMVSAGIIILGLLVVGGALLFSGSRKREGAAVDVMVGDDSVAVVRLLGQPPNRCEASSLAHLAEHFVAGTPRPTIDETINSLRPRTVARWVYPKDAGCVTDGGDTEIGLDRNGQVLWIVPVAEKQPLRYASDAPA